MKPWEETWTRVLWLHDHNQDPIFGIESDAIPKKVAGHFCEFDGGEHARSQLATAAPEMARVLLRLHKGEMVSSGCVTEALRSAGVIPSFEEEAAALEALDRQTSRT
jgi:hypothetical protein